MPFLDRDPWVLDLLEVGDVGVQDVLALDGRFDPPLVGQDAVIDVMCEGPPVRRHGSERASSGKIEAFQRRFKISSGPLVGRFAQRSA